MGRRGVRQEEAAGGVRQGVFSPDGKRLAYISLTSEPNGAKIGNIVVSNADGSQPKAGDAVARYGAGRLSNGLPMADRSTSRDPTSPDATQVVNYQIYAMDADGSHLQALTRAMRPTTWEALLVWSWQATG